MSTVTPPTSPASPTSSLATIYDLDSSVLPLVERMQYNGIGVDVPYFAALADTLTDKIQKEVSAIWRLTGLRINPNSPDQAADLIYNKLGVDSSRAKRSRKTGKLSTNKKSVEALRTEHAAINHLVTARELSKARDSFAVPIATAADRLRRGLSIDYRFRVDPVTGLLRIQCNLRITRVVSGRLAASSPNLLAIPVRTEIGLDIRRGFVTSPGPRGPRVLATWDMDQIEMRVMADESGDEDMVQLFNDNRDIHGYTAARMFRIMNKLVKEMGPEDFKAIEVTKKGGKVDNMKHRYPAKRVGFGVITGITGVGLLDQMRMAGIEGWDVDSCDQLIYDYLHTIFPGVNRYMQQCRHEAVTTGRVIEVYGGRTRYLPGASSPIDRVAEEAKRQSHSHRISAGAQTLMKRAMRYIYNEVLPTVRATGAYFEPLLQVHDELLFEMDADVFPLVDAMVVEALSSKTIMEVPEFRVPLGAKGGAGSNWAELEK